MTSNSCSINNSKIDSHDNVSKKLSLIHITCTTVSGILPILYLGNPHAHGKPWVHLSM